MSEPLKPMTLAYAAELRARVSFYASQDVILVGRTKRTTVENFPVIAPADYAPIAYVADEADARWYAASVKIYDFLMAEIERLEVHIKDLNHDVQAAVDEANWQHRQGDEYGSY